MDALYIVFICAEVALGLISASVNVCVLYDNYRTRQSDFIRKTFVMGMIAADFMVGLFVVPASVMVYAGQLRHYWGCYAVTSAILGAAYVSVLTRIAVAMERFLAVCKPFLHESALTASTSVCLSLCLWPSGLLIAFIPMYFWGNIPSDLVQCTFYNVKPTLMYFQLIIMVLTPLVLLIGAYIYFLITVHGYRKLVRNSQTYAMFVIDKSVQDTLERDLNIAMIAPGLLIIMFVIFWLPFNILLNLGSMDCFLASMMWSHANALTYPSLFIVNKRRIQDIPMHL